MSLANTLKRFYRVVFRRDVLGPLGVSKKENAGQLVLPAAEEEFFRILLCLSLIWINAITNLKVA